MLYSKIFGDFDRSVSTVADLAKIPKAKREAFCNGITELCEIDEFSCYPKSTDAKVIAAAQAVRAASNAVLALDPSQLKQVEKAAFYVRRFVLALNAGSKLPGVADPSLDEPLPAFPDACGVPVTMRWMDAIFGELIGRAAGYQPTGKRGHPKGAVANPDLRYVVEALRRLVRENGGELKLSNDNGTAAGGIVQALRLLAPYLPQGLVPEGRIKHSFLKPPKT